MTGPSPSFIGLDPLLALIAVLGILLLAAGLLRWLGPQFLARAQGRNGIELVASRLLDGRTRASVLRFRDRIYLVVSNGSQVTLLDRLAEDPGDRGGAVDG